MLHVLSLLFSFNHELVYLSSKKILTKSKALLNLVTVSPCSLSAKFIGYVLATPLKVNQFVTKLIYHINPSWLYSGMATFLTPNSAKGRLAPNACHKMIAQKNSNKNQGGEKNVQGLEFLNLNALFPMLVSPPSLSSFFLSYRCSFPPM